MLSPTSALNFSNRSDKFVVYCVHELCRPVNENSGIWHQSTVEERLQSDLKCFWFPTLDRCTLTLIAPVICSGTHVGKHWSGISLDHFQSGFYSGIFLERTSPKLQKFPLDFKSPCDCLLTPDSCP